jgi:aminotransferase
MVNRSALDTAGIQQRTEHISDRVRQIIISPIKEIALLASTKSDVVHFAWGIPHVETPLHIREELRDALLHDPELGQYSPTLGLPALRQAVAEKLTRQFGVPVDPMSEVVISAGAMEMLMVAMQVVVNPGDEVIMTDPSFASYQEQVTLAGGVPKFLPLREEKNWTMDLAALPKLVTLKTKAIILCSPNNPTGTVFSEAELRAVADLAVQHNLIVVTDEPYHFLTYDGVICPTLVSDERLRNNRIACFSFSKEYAMTGYRVGYVFAEAGMIRQLLKVHDNTLVSAPRPSQVAALAALQGDQQCVEDLRLTLQCRRDAMCEQLDTMSKWFSYVRPQGSYYVFVKFLPESVNDVQMALDILNEVGVAVVPGSAFGPAGKNHFRLCFGCTEPAILKGVGRLKQFMRKYY